MPSQNLVYRIALTLVKGIGDITARQILETLGDAEQLFKEKNRILQQIPGITLRVIAEIRKPEILKRAEKEVEFVEKNNITPLFITDSNYPQRLKECVDAPVMLYFKGNTNLNTSRIVSIVGTRHATNYGKEITETLIRDLAEKFPDILIISGLAYGIDIIAHKAALKEKISTIGVLAHGLDRIYPFQHRQNAIEMLEHGGLLTDFTSGTKPDRPNFVKRNRIVAGISDCTIVIESAEKGGALITAHIADSYNRDVFAVPGRTNDIYSQGCNKLIKLKKAILIENAEDMAREMCWVLPQEKNHSPVIQRKLFIELSEEGQFVTDILSKTESMHLNLIAIETNMPVSQLSVVLFELEMNGIVRSMPGGMYKLI